MSRKNARLAPLLSEQSGVHHIAHETSFEKLAILLLKFSCPLFAFAAWYAVSTGVLLGARLSITDSIGCVFAFLLISSYLFVVACVSKKYFILRQWGITLPLLFLRAGRLNWSWSQLVGVVFSRSSRDLDMADQLVLRFQPAGRSSTVDVHVRLNEIDQLNLKKMIYAIVTNAPHAVIEPPLDKVALEFPTVTGIKHLNFQNFTSLWDEEFSTRYSPTLFVPLAPEDELRSGAIKITELVACGGSAAIYSAKNSIGEQIIVKEAVIPKNSPEALKAKAIELFNREALLLSKLDHPHIAKVFDHFVENEHHYEVIEYIDGLDLRRFVKERGPQPEDFVLNWAQQICEILVYLHSQDPPIIHRDLTPDNLVLRVDGQLVLIDFGAANAFVGTATGTMVGKQSYMPPEQLRGKAVPQSDIYSLGATCYFLLTGRDPTPLEVSQVDKNANLPLSLNPLLAKCTATDVADRYETSLDLLDSIRRIRKQRIVEAASDPIHETT